MLIVLQTRRVRNKESSSEFARSGRHDSRRRTGQLLLIARHNPYDRKQVESYSGIHSAHRFAGSLIWQSGIGQGSTGQADEMAYDGMYLMNVAVPAAGFAVWEPLASDSGSSSVHRTELLPITMLPRPIS